jgi:hypothetical protein
VCSFPTPSENYIRTNLRGSNFLTSTTCAAMPSTRAQQTSRRCSGALMASDRGTAQGERSGKRVHNFSLT